HDVKEMESSFFPDDNTFICSGWHQPIEFRDAQTGRLQRTAPISGMTHAAFSPDATRMVTTHLSEREDNRIGVWRLRDCSTGNIRKEVAGLQYVWSADFSPTGWLLAVSTDKSVRVYDTASWHEVARFESHEGAVRTVFFGSNDQTLVSASAEDGTALVWSLD